MTGKLLIGVFGAITLNALAINCYADAGTVTFTGKIQAASCDVTAPTRDQTVDFGTVSTKEFTKVGDIIAPKSFHIDLENCPPSVAPNNKVALRFDGIQNATDNTLLSVNHPAKNALPNPADGVGIGVYNQSDNTQVDLYSDTEQQNIDYSANAAQGKASFKLLAKLKSTAATVTVGSINSVATFSVSYN